MRTTYRAMTATSSALKSRPYGAIEILFYYYYFFFSKKLKSKAGVAMHLNRPAGTPGQQKSHEIAES